MPYDTTDAYLEIQELKQAYGILIQKLKEKGILEEEKKDDKR